MGEVRKAEAKSVKEKFVGMEFGRRQSKEGGRQ